MYAENAISLLKFIQERTNFAPRDAVLVPRRLQLCPQPLQPDALLSAIRTERLIKDTAHLLLDGVDGAHGRAPVTVDLAQAAAVAHLYELICNVEPFREVDGVERLVCVDRPHDPSRGRYRHSAKSEQR